MEGNVKRIRPVQVTVSIGAVVDDGETLTPVSVEPVAMSVAQFQAFNLAEQIGTLQAQLDAQRDQGAENSPGT